MKNNPEPNQSKIGNSTGVSGADPLNHALDFELQKFLWKTSLTWELETRRTYNRTAHLAERHKMMQRWADYLDQLTNQTT